jgi:hypothetical protein
MIPLSTKSPSKQEWKYTTFYMLREIQFNISLPIYLFAPNH